MGSKTKWVFIGCGGIIVVLVLCCVVLGIFGYLYKDQLVEKFASIGKDAMKKALLENLPEGVDKQRAESIADRGFDLFIQKAQEGTIDQVKTQKINADMQAAMQDGNVTPEEFDALADQIYETFFPDAVNKDALENLKSAYRKGKADGSFTPEEINEILTHIEKLLPAEAVGEATGEVPAEAE